LVDLGSGPGSVRSAFTRAPLGVGDGAVEQTGAQNQGETRV